MANVKTTKNEASVDEFLDLIEDEQKRKDAYRLREIMEEITSDSAKMWGGSIVGFGEYHYKYASGREGDWMLCGFSPRKGKFSIYTMCDVQKSADILNRLGKHKTGKSCLYIKNLSDIDEDVLKELLVEAIADTKEKYGS